MVNGEIHVQYGNDIQENCLLDKWLISFRGACQTQLNDTISGKGYLEGWIGKGTSQFQ